MLRYSLLALLFAAVSSAAAAPPELRLSEVEKVQPLSYRAELNLDPTKTDFTGTIHIRLSIPEPLSTLWLNASKITVQSASLKAGEKSLPATVVPGGDDFIGFQFPQPSPVGNAEMTIHYAGHIRVGDGAGIFAATDKGEKYLLTQFEATDARDAFPCFDEPSYKVPWQLTITHPAGTSAVSNTPPSSTRTAGGMVVDAFKETKPLPSYLIAFGVGPFEFVPAGTAGRNHVPVRIVVPEGRSAEAAWAAEVTSTILTRLEHYFGIPYPYEKSDQVSVPFSNGFGAMENAGMVTYGQTLILADPKNDTITRRRGYASVAAHELAHQWFGDLVTTNWWDDIWLNEAFATWTEQKILREWKPEWKTAMNDVDAKLFAEGEDSLISARQIRQPIRSKADIGDAFDGITYEKGAAVIGMFENWMGPENFRAGVQNYIRRYAFKTATAGDFLDAVSSGGKRNVTAPFSTFLNQPGVPIVSASVDCKGPKPVVHLHQKRYLPTGSRGSTNSVWSIPVCMRYPGGEQCPLLTTSTADVPLENASSCPDWLQMNSGAKGYYRVEYSAPLLASISRANLTGPERDDFVTNAAALAKGGRMSAADAMTIAANYANDPERDVVKRTIDLVAGISNTLVPEELRPNYQRFVQKTWEARARELGWRPKPGESDETRLLRGPLLEVVAIEGGDHQLADEARALALGWLDRPASLSPDIVSPVLSTAAYYGDAALARKFLDAALKTQDRQSQRRILNALTSFRDPAAADVAHAALMTGKIDFTSGINLLFAGGGDLPGREYRLRWIEQNFDRILQDHPEVFGFPTASFLPRAGEGMCTPEERTQYTSFFAPRASKVPGAQRAYDQTLESIDLCIAQVSAERRSLETFLARY